MIPRPTNRVNVSWDPPSSGWLKLNTDGSSLGNPGRSSYGGVIRNNYGGWVGGYAGSIGYSISLASEICAIFVGLRFIKHLGLNNVIIETDCQAALLLITVNGVDETHPLRWMINACRMYMRDLKCYMVHVKREGNRCADLMAKIGGLLPDHVLVVYEKTPWWLISVLIDDAYKPN